MSADAYSFYFAALEGEKPEPTPGQPECGFWRRPDKDRTTREFKWVPVAIYYDEAGVMTCLDGHR
jgi:hypothetical protein